MPGVSGLSLRTCHPAVGSIGSSGLINGIHPARVVVADQRPAVRSALGLIVTDSVGMQVVAEVGDVSELWSRMQTIQSEVLLLDWDMVSTQAGTLMPALRSTRPGLYIIALSGRPEV